LVHLATRNWLKIHGRFKAWAEVSLTKVSEIFPPAGPETLDLCDVYLPHAQAVYAYGKYLDEEDYSQATLAQKLSWYFRSCGSYNTAVALAEEAVRLRKEADESNKPNYLLAVENLNETLHAQSEAANNDLYKQLLPRWEKWFVGWEKNLDPDDQDMQHQMALLSLSNLTASLRAAGEWEAIREIHQRMLKQRVTKYGPDHPFTKTTREALAIAEEELGLHRASESIEKRRLDVDKQYANWEKSLGPDHDITKRNMRNRMAVRKSRRRRMGPDGPTDG
jgi:tetratricopeptide (TPR) repeat protein